MEHIFLLFLAFFLLVTAGYFIFQLLNIEEKNIFTAMWMGMLPIGLLSFFINIFFPLQSYAGLICFLPSLLGTPHSMANLKRYFANNPRQCYIQASLIFVIIFFSLVHASVSRLDNFTDTGLYHLQAVSWSMDYPSVLGLGNLHSRLANTSLWYSLAALVPLDLGYIPIFMSAIFTIATTGWTISHILTVQFFWQKVFFACITPLCYFYLHLEPSLYIDNVSLFFTILVMYEILKIALSNDQQVYSPIALIIAFLALGFSIKPLIIIPLLLGVLLCFYLYYHGNINFKSLVKIFFIPTLLGMAWCTRNAIVSGYPIFPTTLFALPVDWIMLPEHVKGNRLAVMGWARWPRSGYLEALQSGIFYWFPSWFDAFINDSRNWKMFILPLFSALLLWAIIFCKNGLKAKSLFIFAFSITSIVYWFYMYPATRFGAEFVWTLLASGCAIFVTIKFSLLDFLLKTVHKNFHFISYTLVFVILINFTFIYKGKSAPIAWKAHSFPSVAVKEVVLAQNNPQEAFTIWTPDNKYGSCGFAPLPCVFINNQLRMRKHGDISQGFYMLRKNESE